MSVQGVRSKELESRCRLLAERLTESALIVDHDPSLALYRLQEHMNRSLPVLVKAKIGLSVSNQRMVHMQRDLDNAIGVVQGMSAASSSMERGSALIKEAIQLKQAMLPPVPIDTKARSKSFHGRRTDK